MENPDPVEEISRRVALGETVVLTSAKLDEPGRRRLVMFEYKPDEPDAARTCPTCGGQGTVPQLIQLAPE